MIPTSGYKKGEEGEYVETKSKTWELFKEGYSFRDIGKELKISHTAAHRYVKQILNELHEERLNLGREYIESELKRLDDMLKVFSKKAKTGDKDSGELVLKIMQRRSKFLGMDSPEKKEVSGNISFDKFIEGSFEKKDNDK